MGVSNIYARMYVPIDKYILYGYDYPIPLLPKKAPHSKKYDAACCGGGNGDDDDEATLTTVAAVNYRSACKITV